MKGKKKGIILAIAVLAIILCILLLLRKSVVGSTISVQKFVDLQNGNVGVSQIIALTKLTNEYDLVFYYNQDNHITANILIKSEFGDYIGLVMTNSRSLDDVNHVVGSSRNSLLPGHTLYWGIAQSPEWKINHPNAHLIVVDDLALGFYFHDESLEERTLNLKFVHIENVSVKSNSV